jgi:hypothetical protein
MQEVSNTSRFFLEKCCCVTGLYHPLGGISNPKYKLLHFLKTIYFYKDKKVLAFNWDRCCNLALCLWLILFHLAINFVNLGKKFAPNFFPDFVPNPSDALTFSRREES